jgi:NitT/TauT family transport system ATP-binding protein
MSDTTRDPAIQLTSITKYFYKNNARLSAVADVDLDIESGTFTSLIGPSGCGKSTLLNMMAGLMTPDVGQITSQGSPLEGLAVGVGYMTQHDTLLPWRTVEENIRLPLEINNGKRGAESISRQEMARRISEVLELVHLTGFGKHLPREISGGMLKRTALAQALVYAQGTILMDEPFGALDSQTRLELQRQLSAIWTDEARTVVLVTHDIEEAIALSDRIVVMEADPGKIKTIIDVDLKRPRDPVAIRFEPGFQDLFRRVWTEMHPEDDAAGRRGHDDLQATTGTVRSG